MRALKENKKGHPQSVKYVSGDHRENAKTKAGRDLVRRIKIGGSMTSLLLRRNVV